MDHCQITVLNGAMVSTKRGLQVAKSTHHGIRFVHSYAAPEVKPEIRRRSSSSSEEDVSPTASTTGSERQFKFIPNPRGPAACSVVEQDEDKARHPRRDSTKRRTRRPRHQRDGHVHDAPERVQAASNSTLPKDDDRKSLVSPEPETLLSDIWESYTFGFPISKRSRKMVHAYFYAIPSKMYPLEHILTHNPIRTPGFYERMNHDSVTMRCVVGTGLFMQTIVNGVRCNDEILGFMAGLYAVVNEQLQAQQANIRPALIECICSMAIGATYIGQYDHWRLHMQGLKRITEMQPEATRQGGYLMNKLRRADIKGAAIVGELPYLNHHRAHQNISDVLPQGLRDSLSRSISYVFTRCEIDRRITTTSLAGLAIFTRAIRAASGTGKGGMLFAPDAFIDEWYWVLREILHHPGPLCDPSTPAQGVRIDMAQTGSHGRPGIVGIRMPPPGGVAPAHAENLLEPAVRLAGVLYVEALVPDEPRTLNGYAIMLALATETIRAVMQKVRRRPFVDGDCHNDGLPSFSAMRPAMIWVALVAYVVAWLGDGEVQWDSPRYDRSVYRECLAFFIGSAAGDVDRLTGADMVLCDILDVKELLRKDVRSRHLLRTALLEWSEGQADSARKTVSFGT